MINNCRGLFNRDMMRENIHKCCEKIFERSPRILEFILSKVHKNQVPSLQECKGFDELENSIVLKEEVQELRWTLNGRPYYLPDHLEFDKPSISTLSSIALPIFIEEAKMMLLTEEYTAPNNRSNLQHGQESPVQSQYTVAGDENHDSDNDLQEL